MTSLVDLTRYAQAVLHHSEDEPPVGQLHSKSISEADLDEEALKLLVRNGVPEEYRGDWWRVMTEGIIVQRKLGNAFYENALTNVFGKSVNILSQAPLFGGKPLDYSRFFLTSEGQAAVSRVLSVIAYNRPDFDICLVLPTLVVMLMHYMSEADAYFCVIGLLESKRHVFLIRGQAETIASADTFIELISRRMKKLTIAIQQSAAHCNFSDFQMRVNFFDCWQSWVVDGLPFVALRRVFDSFFLEGSKVLYRASIALVALSASEIKEKCAENFNILNDILYATARAQANPNNMLMSAFKLYLSRKEITEIYDRKRPLVDLKRLKNSDAAVFHKRIPLLSSPSTIMSDQELQEVWRWIPNRFKETNLIKCFSSDQHGYSLTTLLQRIADFEPSLIVIKTSKGHVFGAYCSTNWQQRKGALQSFGTGETFLFSLKPTCTQYPWKETYQDEGCMYQLASSDSLAVGAGGGGYGLQLDQELRGSSGTCLTFQNPPLAGEDGANAGFESAAVEVYGFTLDEDPAAAVAALPVDEDLSLHMSSAHFKRMSLGHVYF